MRNWKFPFVTLAVLALAGGCIENVPAQATDAGLTLEDGGAKTDAGSTPDGCVGEDPDAGSTPDAGALPDAGLSVEQLCGEYAAAICDYFQRCGLVDSPSECVRVRGEGMAGHCLEDLARPVAAGRVHLDAQAWPTCAQALASSVVCSYSFNLLSEPACAAAIAGQGQQGDNCFGWLDCASPFFCDTKSTCPGTCASRVGLGQPAQSLDACALGLHYFYADGTCQVPVPLGQPCSKLSGAWPQVCEFTATCSAAGVCVLLGGAGDACQSVSDCAMGFDCGTSGTCAPLSRPGEACSGASCTYELTCDSVTPAGAGTCVNKSETGGACWNSWDCHYGNYQCFGADQSALVRGTCLESKAQGEVCTSMRVCQLGLYCEAGSCQPRKDGGESCTLGEECLSWSCNAGQCAAPGCFGWTP